jgi:predicted flap endonuclease-1-like 5' DNA nuclease
MNYDLQTTLLIIGGALAVIILLWLVLRSVGRRQSLQREAREEIETQAADPYAGTKERPYVKPPAPTLATPLPPMATEVPARDDAPDVAPVAVPIMGDFAGIAFPAHSTDHPDELTRLKGVGPRLAALLNDQGISRYAQLASLDQSELAALEERLGAFKGRLTRDRVVEQARLLTSGEVEEFEATFGKLG